MIYRPNEQAPLFEQPQPHKHTAHAVHRNSVEAYRALNKLGHHYRAEIDDACFDGQVTITANPETPRLDLTPLGTAKAKHAAAQGVSVERDILYGYVADAVHGSRLSPTVSQRRAS